MLTFQAKKVRVPKSSFTVTTWVAYSWCKFWGGLYTSAWHETKLHGNCMIYQLGGWLIEMGHSAPTIPFIEALRCHKLLSSPRWPSWWLKPGLFPWFSTSWTWMRRTKPFFLICKTTKIHWSDLVRPAITCTGFGECSEYRLSSDPPPCVLLFGAVLLCTYLNVCLTIHPSRYLTICLSIQPSISSSFVCTFWVHSNDVFKSLISWLGPVYCFKQVRILRLSRMAKLLRAVPELVCEPRGKPGWNLVDAGHMEYHFNFRHENDMFLLGLLGFETQDIVCVIVD